MCHEELWRASGVMGDISHLGLSRIMRVFIVHAHHEPTSFNSAMTEAAKASLERAGHEVTVSDLHAMGFDPVSDRRNFTTTALSERLKQQVEEEYASGHAGFVRELQAEMDKLSWCEVLILQFPLWWLGMPAILKGWVDRVFALGRVYGGGRYFGTGVLRGKRALCATTVGGSDVTYSPAGMYGPIEPILFPIHHGILRFCGFDVLEPFVVYAPTRLIPNERRDCLRKYAQRVLRLDTEVPFMSATSC